MGKSQKPLQHAQSDAQHPPFARSVTSKLVETQADHGAITEAETQTTLKEVQAAAVMTAVAGATVAERMHCTAYIKLLKMFAKVHNAKGLSMWRHTQFPY
jgi:hypothetical protein